MQPKTHTQAKSRRLAPLLALGLAAFLYWGSLPFARAQSAADKPAAPEPTNGTPPAPAADGTNAAASAAAKSTNDLIQLSFQGANIDMVAQWLAETTGKNVIKHPQVQCQVTIVGSKKVTRTEAVTMIYHALEVEGYTAIESAQSILLVPQDKEPKLSPQMLAAGERGAAGGREKEVKVFALQYAQAADLKDKVKTVLSEKATIETDEHANALVITDYHDNVAVAGELVRALDIDRTLDLTVRVIPLKNANAADLAKEVEPLYEKSNGKDSKDPIQVSANDRSNSLLVRSSQSNFKTVQQLVASLDTEEAQDKIMQAFTLANADAQDVAKQLQELYSEQQTTARYYINYGQQNNQANKKMTVVSDRRRNAIIVQATPLHMERIAKLVAALDEPIKDNSLAPKIYPLKYVSAADIEDVLNQLFLKKTTQRNYYFYDEEPEAEADLDAGRLYGKVRITSEPYSNAIIVTANSLENLQVVEEVLRQLDVPSEAGESTFRVGLKFADAPVMAKSINILFAKGGSPPLRAQGQENQNNNPQQNQQQNQQQQQNTSQSNFELEQQAKEEGYYPWIGGQPDNPRANDTRAQRPVSDLIGRVRVVPDERSNSLLISANVHFFPQILKLIEDMDVPTAEVMIDARIIEVSSGFLDQMGTRWAANGTNAFTAADFDNALLASSGGQYQKGFGGSTQVNSAATSSLASAISSVRSGVLNNSVNMDVLIQFLKENTGASVLAEPKLEIKDNEVGKLFVGQQVPLLSSSITTEVGGQNQSFQYKDVGVILEVEPHINEAGDVQLRIRAESSTLESQTLLGGSIIDTRNFRTEMTAHTGQTLIVGGIIQNQTSDTYRKTPLLGDIPLLKWAFNKKDKSTQRVELLVFLRPKVTRTPQEARLLLEDANKSMPLIRGWEKTEAESNAKMDKPKK